MRLQKLLRLPAILLLYSHGGARCSFESAGTTATCDTSLAKDSMFVQFVPPKKWQDYRLIKYLLGLKQE